MLFINIDVPDLQDGLRFYTAAFGLRPGRRLGDEAIELVGGEAPIYLLERKAIADNSPTQRTYARHWTPVHLDFAVPDIESAIARAVAAGAKVENPVATFAWGKVAVLADPFGHGFCLLQFLGRGYDEVATPPAP